MLTFLVVIGMVALAYSKSQHPRRSAPQDGPSSAQRAERPNIIVFEADDQSVSQFQRRIMPHTFREIVDSGTTFSEMVATPPLCCPSRAATLTGEYPHNSGVIDNGRRAYPKLEHKRNVLPAWLRRAGYGASATRPAARSAKASYAASSSGSAATCDQAS